MSFIWSLLAVLIAASIYKDKRSGLVVGALVFSHWIIDFVTHPMGAVFGGAPLPPDLPLFLNDSAKVGLGLYNRSFLVSVLTDIGMLITGIIIYGIYRLRKQV